MTSKRVQAFFRIELRQNYPRKSYVGISYFEILNKIASYLEVSLYSRTREKKYKTFFSFMVISHNLKSHIKIIEYFDKFHLYSSKRLSYIDWRYIVNMIIMRDNKPLTSNEISEIEKNKITI